MLVIGYVFMGNKYGFDIYMKGDWMVGVVDVSVVIIVFSCGLIGEVIVGLEVY